MKQKIKNLLLEKYYFSVRAIVIDLIFFHEVPFCHITLSKSKKVSVHRRAHRYLHYGIRIPAQAIE